MYIKKVVLKNFKSFKDASITFLPSINALVGPNGSGKSNVCDAIRFALGETSLKVLRAKNVRELVHRGKESATVKLVLEDQGKEYELVRKIDTKGKVKYYINGKRVRQRDIYDFKISHGLSHSGRATIGQGEVESIVRMHPKEKRKFLEDVAGVASYEKKKEEALRELGVVEQRIRETNLVLGEKMSYLEQLKKEKEEAEAYIKMKERLDSIKYTLTIREIRRITKRIDFLNSRKEELNIEKAKLEETIKILEKKIEELMNERSLLSKEVEEKTKRNKLFQEIEQLKAELKVKKEKASMLEKAVFDKEEELKGLKEEIDRLQEEMKKAEVEGREAKKKAESIKVEKIKKEDEKLARLNADIESLTTELNALEKERAIKEERLNSVTSKLSDLINEIDELQSLSLSSKEDLEKRLKEIDGLIRKSFEDERAINNRLSEKDKEIIKIRERLAVLRASSQTRVNPAHYFVEELKTSGKIEGIYGRVIDLIKFDNEIAEAVEAAGGSRLTYFVVKNLNVAKKVIDALRNAKAGRVTLIPVEDLKVNRIKEGDVTFIKDLVEIESGLSIVLDYVFGDTVLVSSFEEGKRMVGKHRAVTLKGELFEQSGVVSGGKSKSSLTAGKLIAELEKKLKSLIDERSSLIEQLRDLRKELNDLRAEKARVEANIAQQKEERARIEKAKQKLSFLKKEYSKLVNQEESLKKELHTLNEKIKNIEKTLTKKKEERDTLFKKFKVELEESERKAMEQASIKAMLLEKAKSLLSTFNNLKRELGLKTKKMKELSKEVERLRKEMRQISDDYRLLEGELKFKENEFRATSKKLDELMERIADMEKELQKLGEEEKRSRDKLSKVEKELNKIDVELSGLNVKVEELEKSIKEINGIELKEPNSKLENEMKELSQKLANMQNINFAAKELYYKLFDEVGEIKEKIEKLKVEKDSIIELMNEIDKRKKEALLKALDEVNENLKKISEGIPNFGIAELYLDNLEDPFNAGLHISLTRPNGVKENIMSLSGGEKTLLALMLIFAMQFTRPSPFYILDEVDAALDVVNSERMPELIHSINKEYGTQFILVSHNERVIKKADAVIGVARVKDASKVVHFKQS